MRIEIFDFNTNESHGIYDNMIIAANAFDISPSSISSIISNNIQNYSFTHDSILLSARRCNQPINERVQWRLFQFYKRFKESKRPSILIHEDDKGIRFNKNGGNTYKKFTGNKRA